MSTQKWEKKGLVFRPDTSYEWMISHASLPTPLRIGNSIYRVYFSSRDCQNRSHIGYFDIDLNNPTRVLDRSDRPILEPGPLGCFDSDGIYAASVVRWQDEIRLYTIGWNAGVPRPMFNASIGLAISHDKGRTFKRYCSAPIMARSKYDPCLVTSPVVLYDQGQFRMWYVSGYKWTRDNNGTPESHYHIKYASSFDGKVWDRDGHVCIDHKTKSEKNIARCCVMSKDNNYKAWYSFKSDKGQYQIGYAESKDGLIWLRKDGKAKIELSEKGWDSQAITYPYVVDYDGYYYMFYNGNDFGKDGIGLAIAEA